MAISPLLLMCLNPSHHYADRRSDFLELIRRCIKPAGQPSKRIEAW